MAAPPHRRLLNKFVGDNIPVIPPQLCEPFCNVIINPTGICPSTCLSFCNPACRIPEIPPPPPATITHGTSNKPRGLAVFLTISVFILVITFLFIIYKLYSRRRSSQQQQPEHEEDPDPIEHHVWLIRTIGLEQSVISGITVVKYKKGDGFVEGTDCSVCLSEFQENESLRLLSKCNHAFHVPCIDTWLRSHTNCPVCRAGVVKNAELILPPSQEEVLVENLVSGSSSSRREITSEFGNTELNIIGILENAMKNDENHREEGYK